MPAGGGLPSARICSLHPKGKAEDLPTVAKANNCPGKFCCFSSVCSPARPQLCLKHSINYNCTSATKLMSNTNPALDLEPRLHSTSLNSSTACAKNNAPKEEAGQKAHLASLESLLLQLSELLKPLKSNCHCNIAHKALFSPCPRTL